MKILKYLLFAIIGLAIFFFGLGLAKPSIKYGHEITVDKPLRESWAVHQDPSKLNQWIDGFKSIELIEGERGAVGSKYKVLVTPSPEQGDFEMIETIISKKELDHISLTFDSEMMRFDQKTSFSQSNGKTVVITDSEVFGKGILMRSMFAMMEVLGGTFQSQEVKNIEALKKTIEQNTTNYFPSLEIQ